MEPLNNSSLILKLIEIDTGTPVLNIGTIDRCVQLKFAKMEV